MSATRVLFLEAEESTLLTRLQGDAPAPPAGARRLGGGGIARSASGSAPLREHAETVVDTTGLTASALRKKIADEFLPAAAPTPRGHLPVLRLQARPAARRDLAFDVRFLPNPH